MATATAGVTYTKLRDGSWGLRGPAAALKPGASVTVAKRSGETKTETVGRVLWTGDGVAMTTIAGGSAPARTGGTGAPNARRARAGRRGTGDCDDFCQGCPRCY